MGLQGSGYFNKGQVGLKSPHMRGGMCNYIPVGLSKLIIVLCSQQQHLSLECIALFNKAPHQAHSILCSSHTLT